MVSCDLILCESVLSCQSYWLFFFSFFYVLRVVIVYLCILAKTPSAQVFRPASSYLSIALQWRERIDHERVSARHKGLFNSLT